MWSVRSFNSSMFFSHVAEEGTWPLKFRPWLMWSGFNETRWVHWTCSVTRGLGGGGVSATAGFWLSPAWATLTGVWLAFCDIINTGPQEKKFRVDGWVMLLGGEARLVQPLTRAEQLLWNAQSSERSEGKHMCYQHLLKTSWVGCIFEIVQHLESFLFSHPSYVSCFTYFQLELYWWKNRLRTEMMCHS